MGLMDNPVAFKRWMVSGPELSRMNEFEEQFKELDDYDEEGLSSQKAFQSKVQRLVEIFMKMGNPFKDEFTELVTLDARDVMDECVANSMRQIQPLGHKQYNDYKKNVLIDCIDSVHSTIKRNSLPLFSTPVKHTKSKEGNTIEVLIAAQRQ